MELTFDDSFRTIRSIYWLILTCVIFATHFQNYRFEQLTWLISVVGYANGYRVLSENAKP